MQSKPTDSKKLLLLSENDVRSALNMPTAIAVMEEAFREFDEGRIDNVPRQRAQADGIVLHQMSAACEYLNVVGWKTYTTTRHGAQFHVAIYEQESGSPLALIEADWLGRMRTGAVTGLAVRFLTDRDADRVGLLGCGRQAATQLAAIAAVRAIDTAYVYSRDPERRQAFADAMTTELQTNVIAVDSAEAAVENLPIVVSATSSRHPVLEDAWVADGALLCAVGSNWPHKQEISEETVLRCELVICDDVDACRNEAGELIAAAEHGWQWESAQGLAQVVAGKLDVARSSDPPHGPRLFKSVGLAMEDVALAVEVVRHWSDEKEAALPKNEK
jgi:ornithine cyclodeaminase/alanine dehydrogenase-like protein (mu-crystallin family)